MKVVRHKTAREFLDRAEAWLLAAEAENNLILGVCHTLLRDPDRYGSEPFLLTVECAGKLVGAAFITPPYRLGLTRMGAEAFDPLADFLEAEEAPVPGVLGPLGVAGPFARRWASRNGKSARLGMAHKIYACHRVRDFRAGPGSVRAANRGELPLLTDWTIEFLREVGLGQEDTAETVRERVQRNIAEGLLHLWQDGEPVSMAGCEGQTPRGSRIGPVYTPPPHRRKGYATACVAALTRAKLEAGKRACYLYADRNNPTSNRIYQEIGYLPVCDSEEWRFE